MTEVKKKRTPKSKVEEVAKDVEEGMGELDFVHTPRFDQVVSTGSTLLDLAISGGRTKGGGIPAGYFVELYGPPSAGKTAVMVEIAGSIKKHGGACRFNDTEGRLDKDYSTSLGVPIPESEYICTHTVEEFDTDLSKWQPKPEKEGAINAYFVDSVAAMTCDWEVDDKDGMGGRKAKQLQAFFRKNRKHIIDQNMIVFLTNQLYEGPTGENTPGGKGPKFYSSIRMRVGPFPSGKYIKDKIKVAGQEVEKTIGTRSIVTVKKSSLDDPFRTAPISIVFNYGIDDVRENLQFLKKYLGESQYVCPDDESFKAMRDAIKHIEEYDQQNELREQVIDVWMQIEQKFREKNVRKPKERW